MSHYLHSLTGRIGITIDSFLQRRGRNTLNVKAFVILKEDVRGVTSYDLIKHCRQKLLPYEVPNYIEFRDMLPKSKVGKLLRREMRDEEQRKLGGKTDGTFNQG